MDLHSLHPYDFRKADDATYYFETDNMNAYAGNGTLSSYDDPTISSFMRIVDALGLRFELTRTIA